MKRKAASAEAAGTVRRVLRVSLCCVAALFCAASGASKATVTDVSGQTYNVVSMRLAKGSKLTVDCGGARMEFPLNAVKSIKINPKQISSIGGRLHFGIELLLRDSTAMGGGSVRCYTSAGNGIIGKSSKGKFTLPFEKLRYVYILGKEDVEKKAPDKKGGAAEQPGGGEGGDNLPEPSEIENGASERAQEGAEPPAGESNATGQPEKGDDGETTRAEE